MAKNQTEKTNGNGVSILNREAMKSNRIETNRNAILETLKEMIEKTQSVPNLKGFTEIAEIADCLSECIRIDIR